MLNQRHLLQDEEIVILQQIIVSIPCLGSRRVINRRELVEHARWRLGAVVEEEHDPEVNHQAVLGCEDNCRLVVRVVVGEIAKSRQHLGRLIRSEDIVAAPDLSNGVRLHGVCGDDAKVVTTSLERSKKVCSLSVCDGVNSNERISYRCSPSHWH